MSTWSDAVMALSPYAYYKLDEASGDTVLDSSGNARHATCSTVNITHNVASLVPGDPTGKSKTVASSTATPCAPTGLSYNTQAVTYLFTFAGSYVASGDWLRTATAYRVATPSATSIDVRAGVSMVHTIPSGLYDGNPHLIGIVLRPTGSDVWIDGVKVSTVAATIASFTVTQVALKGVTTAGPAGTYDEFPIYTSSLSDANMEGLYAAWTGGGPPAATMSLVGNVRAKTASFAVATVLAASLAGSVQPKTANFDLLAGANLALAGTVQAKTGTFGLDLPSGPDRTASLVGTVAGKSAAFAILGGASVSLAGTLQAKAGDFSLTAVSTADRMISLAGSLRRKTASVALAGAPSLRLAASLRPKTGAGTIVTLPTVQLAGTIQPKLATFVTYVVAPVTPAPLLAAGHSVVAASAFGAVTMQGSQPVYSISTAYTPRARQRILVDNIDVTYFRGGITPNVTYTLLEPLLYGPATLDLPQVSAVFERPGIGALSFLRPGATVEVQRVIDDVVVGTDWKGVIVAFDVSGRTLSVELGGEASGRAALRNRQVPIFPRTNDLGRQFADVIRDLGLPFFPHLGPVTGIEGMTTGGTGHLEHIQTLVAKAWTRAGKHWTIMPDEATGEYEAHRKDDETIHGTVFLNDAKTVANLRRDIAEEPNRVYITGVLKNGQRVRFGVYPGLIQGPTPPFPGHMQMGDTGDGVRLLIGKLHAMGYLKLTETGGGYDQDVYDAVVDLQIDAGLFDEGFTGTAVPGEVNLVTWEALYDLGVTGNSLEWAHIEPAAQRRKVRPWNRSGNGGIMGVNPLYDPNHLVRDRNIDAGSGWENRSQLREFARAVLHDSDDANWVGDITFHTGALIRGDGFEGMTVTEADVMDARELRPGMNLDLPQFDGGTFVHIAAIQVDESGIVTATVDTRFRDAMEVWEVIARNKESRNDPARTRNQRHRSSTIVKDSIGEWDEIGGLLGNDVELEPGWNVFEVVAAMEGTISRLRLTLDTPAEFACAVFGRSITADRLDNLIPAPLTNAGTKMWQSKRDELDERWLLYSAGTKDEPCGYSPGRKQERTYDEGTDEETTVTVNDPTGKHIDEAGFAYRSYNRTDLTIAVWVAEENKIESQRVVWNQLEASV